MDKIFLKDLTHFSFCGLFLNIPGEDCPLDKRAGTAQINAFPGRFRTGVIGLYPEDYLAAMCLHPEKILQAFRIGIKE
jgi:hypothetical protein